MNSLLIIQSYCAALLPHCWLSILTASLYRLRPMLTATLCMKSGGIIGRNITTSKIEHHLDKHPYRNNKLADQNRSGPGPMLLASREKVVTVTLIVEDAALAASLLDMIYPFPPIR